MQTDLNEQLLALNREFYQSFAQDFSATRQRLQPGVAKIAHKLNPQASVLDVGCGNGAFGHHLLGGAHQGKYLGIDGSPGLIAAAQSGPGHFEVRDISDSQWTQGLSLNWAHITAFAVLHHFPRPLQRQILRQLYDLLGDSGELILSNWQFLNSPRLAARVLPWSHLDLDPADLSPDDYLLDWRRGGQGFRYVHHFSEESLAELAEQTGFEVVASYYSDGKEGNLALYQRWRSS